MGLRKELASGDKENRVMFLCETCWPGGMELTLGRLADKKCDRCGRLVPFKERGYFGWSNDVTISQEEYSDLVCRMYVRISHKLDRAWAEKAVLEGSKLRKDLGRLYMAMNPELTNETGG